ncbi:MAG: hypothetical protein PHR77_12140 [Kiritimatiellae bacterium]|nr:hypothetical protein [Kiritimatiellia bacterium]MDD5519498.1 hypothetical protein [Kiritimatiellia bacterium]
MKDAEVKLLAKVITLNCVRNTIIERYHTLGKLSDAEMKAFNTEVVNRIYTFMNYFLNKSKENEAFLERMNFIAMGSAQDWNEPELDKRMWND